MDIARAIKTKTSHIPTTGRNIHPLRRKRESTFLEAPGRQVQTMARELRRFTNGQNIDGAWERWRHRDTPTYRRRGNCAMWRTWRQSHHHTAKQCKNGHTTPRHRLTKPYRPHLHGPNPNHPQIRHQRATKPHHRTTKRTRKYPTPNR